MTTLPSRSALVRQLMPFAKSSTTRGLFLFGVDVTKYATCIAGAILIPYWPVQILASILAGVCIANLVTLAHDAAHGSLVRGRRLNFVLGVLSFAPAIYTYRMWVYNHHVLHHARTNAGHRDSYTPLSKAEFDALPRWHQALHRFYRTANPISFGVYYIIERYHSKIYAGKNLPPQVRSSARKHAVFLACYQIMFVAFLLCAPLYSHAASSFGALMLGLILPFFAFHCVFGFFIWTMHTHPDIGFFRDKDIDRSVAHRSELFTVVIKVPKWLSIFSHHVSEHGAHHLIPTIPCYMLRHAQDALTQAMGPHAVVEKLTVHYIVDTMRRCRLYDYERHVWLDFDGTPTSGMTIPFRHLEADIKQISLPMAA